MEIAVGLDLQSTPWTNIYPNIIRYTDCNL